MISIGILTVSDSCSIGKAEDSSGMNLKSLIENGLVWKEKAEVKVTAIVADDVNHIKAKLIEWCDHLRLNLILSTGGTGFAPRDVTPEATRQVIEKEAPSLSTLMLVESLKITPLAALSRAVCGIRGRTLIVNLPGSKKGSQECLTIVQPVMAHALNVLQDALPQVKETHRVLQSQAPQLGQKPAVKSRVESRPVANRPRQAPYPLISVEDALNMVLSEAQLSPVQMVRYRDALGYCVAADVQASDPLPPFPASIKDGYSVIAADCPGKLRVIAATTAGMDTEGQRVVSGCCIRVNTGAPVVLGADAVIQVEDTKLTVASEDGEELEIEVLVPVKKGQDIRPVGSDITKDQVVIPQHSVLGPAELGLLATVGCIEVPVFQKPIVAILSTGNELVEPEQALSGSKIRDSNRITMISCIEQSGFRAVDGGIAPDDPDGLLERLVYCCQNADVIVTSGGVSMGEKDLLRQVLEADFGAKIHFALVRMKPGKPTTFATIEHVMFGNRKKYLFGLPGNPVSSTVTCNLYVLPCLRKMSGYLEPKRPTIKARLSKDVNLDPRPEYFRCVLDWQTQDGIPIALGTGNQISSRLLSMKDATALLLLPAKSEEQKTLAAGSLVNCLLL